jgi:16S rRNA (guanine966-N2)-methyltransferase
MKRNKKRPTPDQQQNSVKSAPNSVRIIAGEWRSRRLTFPCIEGLRPTADRIRETLFNWIAIQTPGAKCLDLFAGSGAMGLEALSRDADHCTFVELNREAARSLNNNLSLLKTTKGKVQQSNALEWLDQLTNGGIEHQRFTLVFLDPPFANNMLQETLDKLRQSNCLAPGALIYWEAAKEQTPPQLPSSWVMQKHKQAGLVQYGLIET